jgi:hypothetical protein
MVCGFSAEQEKSAPDELIHCAQNYAKIERQKGALVITVLTKNDLTPRFFSGLIEKGVFLLANFF